MIIRASVRIGGWCRSQRTPSAVWARTEARAAGVPAYVVFPDSTLTAIAQLRPASLEELMAVNGVGVKKLEQYGITQETDG